jgi:DNA repair exonuclease SbcCD ATPase subunit
MEMAAAKGINESYESLEQVKSAREQIKNLQSKTSGSQKLQQSLEALDKQCADLQGATQSAFYGLPPSGQRPEDFSTLNQHFASILTIAESADAAPTTQVSAAFQELQASAATVHQTWSKLCDHDIQELNSQLKAANLPTIDPNKPLSEKPSEVGDGDDEP